MRMDHSGQEVRMRTAIVRDSRYLEHDMGSFHVENPRRLEVIYKMLEQDFSPPLEKIDARPATEEEIQWIHSASYVRMIKDTSGRDRVVLDPDTSTSPRSYEVARLAVGGVLALLDAVMAGRMDNGFALVRPPGHHAEASRAMGFCLFNNIAVGAEYLIRKHKLSRILIVDWDLHHGNGTQHSFDNRKDILYFSSHQYPHYPGTGHWSEAGKGEGEGFTVNVPLTSSMSDEELIYIYQKILVPIATAFKPEFILVSAGFDIHRDDPLGEMRISGDGFGALTHLLQELSQNLCRDRLVLLLEGGYDLQGLREGVKNVLAQLSRRAEAPKIRSQASASAEKDIIPVLQTQKKYWPL